MFEFFTDYWMPVILGLVLLAIFLVLAFRPSRKQGVLDAALVETLRQQNRIVGKHPALGAGYGAKRSSPMPEPQPQRRPHSEPPKRAITFTPRELERVNIQRRLRGARPLNRAGFENAAAHAWDQPRRQPDTSSDWLNYFIFYHVFLADHSTPRTTVDRYLTIDPDKPYNGHGGETPRAGEAGDWSGTNAYQNGVNAGAGPLPAGDAFPAVGNGPGAANAPDRDASGYDQGDTRYTPPAEDRPSYVPDTSGRPSSVPDTYTPPSAPDPSPASDSGSSGGGGGDSGGGGGGGGGGD